MVQIIYLLFIEIEKIVLEQKAREKGTDAVEKGFVDVAWIQKVLAEIVQRELGLYLRGIAVEPGRVGDVVMDSAEADKKLSLLQQRPGTKYGKVDFVVPLQVAAQLIEIFVAGHEQGHHPHPRPFKPSV